MANGQTVLSKKIDAVGDDVKQVLNILMGDPENPDKPGLVQRVKALEEEREKKREADTWLARAAASPFISAVVTASVLFIGQAIYYYASIKPLLDKIQMEELMKK